MSLSYCLQVGFAFVLVLGSPLPLLGGKVVKYARTVPLGYDGLRVGDVCVDFHAFLTAGQFFDGLERRQVGSKLQFRKDGQEIKEFPESVTVIVRADVTNCHDEGGLAWPPPQPSLLDSPRLLAQWVKGLKLEPLKTGLQGRNSLPWQESKSVIVFTFAVETKGIPLDAPLVLFLLRPNGKQIAKFSRRL